MFELFSVIFPLFFIFVIGMIAFSIFKGVSEWHHNNQQPILSAKTRIVSKRNHVSRSAHNHNGHVHHSSRTTYFVTFEFEDGNRTELHVPAKEFGLIAEGDIGSLTYQGTRFHDFKREIN